ncbi:MAG: transcription-repair coupling factor [Crocinitomicaceae bacterium]|nr:transcription-repair coupling factor [Crocinitomicaceae bacterium]
MNIQEFRGIYSNSNQVASVINQLQFAEETISLNGMVGSFPSVIANSIISKTSNSHLFLLNDKEEAAFFLNDLQDLNKEDDVILFYPHSYKKPYQFESTDNSNVVSRAEVLEKVNRYKRVIVVSYPEAIFEKVVTKKKFAQSILEFKNGASYSLDFVNELFLEHKFEKVDFVNHPGEFAIRGGIVDVYSYSNDEPYRIEFFGDEVDSIRTFHPVNQLSIKTYDRCTVVPDIRELKKKEIKETFLKFIPDQTTVWAKDLDFVSNKLDEEYKKAQEIYVNLESQTVQYSAPNELFYQGQIFSNEVKSFNRIYFGNQNPKSTTNLDFKVDLQPSFNKQFPILIENLTKRKSEGYENIIISNQPKQIERLYSIFDDLNAEVKFTTLGFTLHEGFVDHENKIVCYTDHQIFERYHRFRLKEGFKSNQQALTLKEIYNLQKGDFVTHIDHGIGQFSGLEIIDVNGKPQEAIRLVYKDKDVLYVSIHSLHRIAKYTGKEGTIPKLNKIGSQAWTNTKNKTKAKVKQIAYDLIKLYAKRKQEPGFAFSPDNYLQNELEASFIYEDTPDQLKATKDFKKDMESPNPMDRLICGDVGFGKTEVAIRAAFKAVCDSKQVAVLVPTTILSLQHYKTFFKRLKGLPCNIDYLNRFKSQKQTTETLKKLEAGEIDIIIGTHKLVGKKVKFKDLGLIIIDEEQKFGVGVKDKLKLFKASVDTLTLTATPIPRTLQFSLMGARDLSVINTPPPNRQPVETELITLNEEIIRDAVSYELERGGQVFFVHNRVQNIHEVAGMISRLCPGTRIAVGHGQMDGEKLERIMSDFIEHEYDVLVATTIIESGIDVPNANSIIINNAQNFGLSDLHQMRGRVGRSNKKAFCYLVAPPLHLLPSDSRKRLEAIAHFSELGSGFNISMRDLDIRGAGDLLGGEQSGFISDIGFDMYQKILNEAIQELKEEEFKDLFQETEGEEVEFVTDCSLETDLELLIPDTYVNSVNERLALYQELDGIDTKEGLDDYRKGLEDRFGELPQSASALIDSMHFRWQAKKIGFEKVVLKSKKMIGYFITKQESPYFQSPRFTQVLKFIQTNPSDCKMDEKNNKLRLVFTNVEGIEKALRNLDRIQGTKS